MELPKNINYRNLKSWVDGREPKIEYPTVQSKDLVKIAGGLYRIREDYTNVWSMKEGEDGRSYIVRADDDSERMVVESGDVSQNQRAAYRILQAGDVHVVWECDECNFSNITREGGEYECGQCHVATDDVFGKQEVTPAGMTVEEVSASHSPYVVQQMKKFGLSEVSKELVAQWEKEAEEHKCDCEEGGCTCGGEHCKWCPPKKKARD